MEWWQAVVLGLVEGITEYLPVSSTGHLIIASDLLGLKGAASKDAIGAYEIVIQGGAILAVLGLYFQRFVQMARGVFTLSGDGLRLLINIGIGIVPAAVVGVLLGSVIKAHLFSAGPVVLALVLGGVYMMLVDQWRAGRFGRPRFSRREHGLEEMTPLQALVIGCMQIVSLWPGTSRSMMTITGGMITGLRPTAAAEFSFLLGMPTLLLATVYTLYKELSSASAAGRANFIEVLGIGPVVIGMVVSAVSAAVAVRWLVGFLNRHGLTPFAVYRIVVGIALLGLIVGGVVDVRPTGKRDGAEDGARAAMVGGAGNDAGVGGELEARAR